MKHILHKEVNGKLGADGKTYFYIYISFTDKRQTLRLKSQLVTRPVTKKEYERLTQLYYGRESDLLNKERSILFHCLDINTSEYGLDRNRFRNDYIALTRSMIDIVKNFRRAIGISNWTDPSISWELTKEFEIENKLIPAISKKNYHDKDLFELELNMLQFQLFMRNKNEIEGLFLVYDWELGNLKDDFDQYLIDLYKDDEKSSKLFSLLVSIMKNNLHFI